jgi:hypothetical protein
MQQEVFDALNLAISSPPVLRMANCSQRFILQTDASGVALGAVLSQEHEGVRQPIAYASRTLTAQERKASSIYELECLAVLFGIEKFRKYLEHQEFLLETDNQALSWVLSHPRQLGKIGRWLVKIASLKFQFQHIRGTQNIIADILSPMFDAPTQGTANEVPCSVTRSPFPLVFQDLGKLQRGDQKLASLIVRLEKGEHIPKYSLSKGILYGHSCRRRVQKLIVPEAAVSMVFA